MTDTPGLLPRFAEHHRPVVNFRGSFHPCRRSDNQVRINQLHIRVFCVASEIGHGSRHQTGASSDQICHRLCLDFLLIFAELATVRPSSLLVFSTIAGEARADVAAKNVAKLVDEGDEPLIVVVALHGPQCDREGLLALEGLAPGGNPIRQTRKKFPGNRHTRHTLQMVDLMESGV
jgi:hypothetical protein